MESILTSEFLNSIGVPGLCVLVLIGLTFDKGPLRLARELRLSQSRVELLEKRVDALVEQNNLLTHELSPAVTQFMASMKQAAQEKS